GGMIDPPPLDHQKERPCRFLEGVDREPRHLRKSRSALCVARLPAAASQRRAALPGAGGFDLRLVLEVGVCEYSQHMPVAYPYRPLRRLFLFALTTSPQHWPLPPLRSS